MKKTRLLMMIGFLLTIALGTAMALEHRYQMRQMTKILQTTSNLFTQKVDDVLSEFLEVIKELPETPSCETDIFRNIVYKYRHIKNIGILEDDHKKCDVYDYPDPMRMSSMIYHTTSKSGLELLYWYTGNFLSIASANGYFLEFDLRHFLDFEVSPYVSGFVLANAKQNHIWFRYYTHALSLENKKALDRLVENSIHHWQMHQAWPQNFSQDTPFMLSMQPSLGATVTGVFVDTTQLSFLHTIQDITIIYGLILGMILSCIFYLFVKRSYSLKNMLARDIKRERLFMVYQPLVDIKDSKTIVGFESLVRWQTEEGEMIRPDIFIPVAEANQLTEALTHCIISKVFEDLDAVIKQSPALYVGLNVTPSDLASSNLVHYLIQQIKRYQWSPKNIVIELTERIVADQNAMVGIERLKQAGFCISIDDFGTGASNIKYLGEIEPDVIKVDKAFVDWSETEGPTSQLLAQLIQLGKNFDLKVVVEGVETQAQATRCLQAGADVGQGYFWYKPLPKQEIEDLLLASSLKKML